MLTSGSSGSGSSKSRSIISFGKERFSKRLARV